MKETQYKSITETYEAGKDAMKKKAIRAYCLTECQIKKTEEWVNECKGGCPFIEEFIHRLNDEL